MKRLVGLLAVVTACHGTDTSENGRSDDDPGTIDGQGGGATSTIPWGNRGGASSGASSNGGGNAPLEFGGTGETGGITLTSGGTVGDGGGSEVGDALGAYPIAPSPATVGGTMTFTNIGAPGWWPRRIDQPVGDPACTYKDGLDTWGGHCCMTQARATNSDLAPFDRELTLILKAVDVKQLAIYQGSAESVDANWRRVTAWDARTRRAENLWFTQQGEGSSSFPGDLTKNDCVGYVMQSPRFDCGEGSAYFCPPDPGVLHRGYEGSKLVILLASVSFDDANVRACGSTGAGSPAPWVAIVASELIRDGGRKWNGLCNCYSKTGTVGDGCGEINVFEVVMDDNAFSNREFASTGVRSYQVGHIGGAVAGASLSPADFPGDSDVVDVCSKRTYAKGPVLVAGGATDGCPVWRRPQGDRYYFILLDAPTRTIQVGILHPQHLPSALGGILPSLPARIERKDIDALVALRLPQ
jgi:hypothetical protein